MRSTRVGSVNERFAQRYLVDKDTGCWNWTERVNSKGYGIIAGEINGKRYVPKGQQMLAHRVSWILFRGDIPDSDAAHGTVVMHTCDNPRCVNPKHLQLGTQSDNVKDMVSKGRRIQGYVPSGAEHWNSAFSQADIDLICSTAGRTKELAERFGVHVATIKKLRRRNGIVGVDAGKFANKPLSQEAIDHIRSTKPGTRGLGKLYGVGKTTIANIRKGLTHAR
jgi:HNH endonuclease